MIGHAKIRVRSLPNSYDVARTKLVSPFFIAISLSGGEGMTDMMTLPCLLKRGAPSRFCMTWNRLPFWVRLATAWMLDVHNSRLVE